jgi:cytochrome c556
MAKLAHEQGKEAGLAKVMDALSCKKCHDTYRREKHGT